MYKSSHAQEYVCKFTNSKEAQMNPLEILFSSQCKYGAHEFENDNTNVEEPSNDHEIIDPRGSSSWVFFEKKERSWRGQGNYLCHS